MSQTSYQLLYPAQRTLARMAKYLVKRVLKCMPVIEMVGRRHVDQIVRKFGHSLPVPTIANGRRIDGVTVTIWLGVP